MKAALVEVPTALYHLYDAGRRLLYIGITTDPEKRWREHAQTASWWPEVADKVVQWYPNRREAAAAEIKAIDAEHPLHNKSRKPALRPADAKPTRKTSVYLTDELGARVKASGLTMGELIRRGLDAIEGGAERENSEATLRRVIGEELDKRLGVAEYRQSA